jgi:protein SCO1/2
MVRTLTTAIALLLALAALPGRARAQKPPILRHVGYDQRVNKQVPLGLSFRDESGRAVRLQDYFGGKPVILVLAYFRCPKLCTEVLNGLVQAMLDCPLDIGTDYRVITVSFDPRETPDLAAAKKRAYLQRLGRPAAEGAWHFLTGDKPAIERLTRAVGFRYAYDARFDQFAHPSGILVLTPRGKIYRYFLDIRYSARDLRFSLIEASNNQVGSVIDQVLLFCFHYDPVEGKYGPAVMRLVRLGGVLTMLAIGVFIFVLIRKGRRSAVGHVSNVPAGPGTLETCPMKEHLAPEAEG